MADSRPAILNLIDLKCFKAYSYLKPPICFIVHGSNLAIWHIKVNYGRFKFDRIEIFQVISLHETAHFVTK